MKQEYIDPDRVLYADYAGVAPEWFQSPICTYLVRQHCLLMVLFLGRVSTAESLQKKQKASKKTKSFKKNSGPVFVEAFTVCFEAFTVF